MRFRVGEIAKAKGVTAERLARDAGLGISTVRNIVHNRTTDPGILTLTKIARVLGVSREDLIVDEEIDRAVPPGDSA